MAERCVCCGEIIPEGRQVCPSCEQKTKRKPFDEWDEGLLRTAMKNLEKVYEYNYGSPRMRSKLNRLQTIIRKLEILLEDAEDG